MGIVHNFISAKPDPSDASLVNATHWNDDHSIEPGTIGTAELADASVTAAKLAPGAVAGSMTPAEFREAWLVAFGNNYSQMTYTGKNLTSVDIWDTALMGTKLYTKTLTYTGKDLTSYVTVDEVASLTLTATLTYVGKNLDTVTKVVA